MLNRVDTALVSPEHCANQRVEHENIAVILNGKTYIMYGREALNRPEWPIICEVAHHILRARQMGNTEREAELNTSLEALTQDNGERMAMRKLADIHAARYELVASKIR